MADATFNWNDIRAVDRDQKKGFEELCTQLARDETPEPARFYPNGTPDGGAECYAEFPDGTQWGWQAKFFPTMDFKQINKSVGTALKSYPGLTKYFICFPLNLPNDGNPKRKSARQKWSEYVQRWEDLAKSKGMQVEFVEWNSTELIRRLQRPEHAGKLKFWFNKCGFDQDWFQAKWQISRDVADNRYTPELNVKLPIAEDFERFGRLKTEETRLRNHARVLHRNQSFLGTGDGKGLGKELTEQGKSLYSLVRELIDQFRAVELMPIGPLDFGNLYQRIDALKEQLEEYYDRIRLRQDEIESEKRQDSEKSTYASYYDRPLRNTIAGITNLLASLHDGVSLLESADQLGNANLLILSGEAGTGKSHLFCDIAKLRLQSGLPTVLLMGQRFRNTGDASARILEMLGLAGFSFEEFVGALEAAAQVADTRAMFMIDAINEGDGASLWRTELKALLTQLLDSPWVDVVLSVRTSYENHIVSEAEYPDACRLVHYGFDGVEYDALKVFFNANELELPSTPIFDPEFRNPLFLKTLTEGLNKSGQKRMPRGLRGISAVFDLYIGAIENVIAEHLGYQPTLRPVSRLFEALLKMMIESGQEWLMYTDALSAAQEIEQSSGLSSPLLDEMVSEGLLMLDLAPQLGDEQVISVSYQRLCHYFIAKGLLERELDVSKPEEAFQTGGGLAEMFSKDSYMDPGLLEALCVQVPEKAGVELPLLVPEYFGIHDWSRPFLKSLVWRDADAFSQDSFELMNQLSGSDYGDHAVLDAVLTLTSIPDHPLNADRLDKKLRGMAMPDRDAWWSIYLHNAWDDRPPIADYRSGVKGPAIRLLDWAKLQSPETNVEEESVRLCATTLIWMFTTPNRFVRDHATIALVSLLTGRLETLRGLIQRFYDVDDPYVVERLYAVAYGVVCRSHDVVAVGYVAETVYNCFFESSAPYPHILMRDYARGVLERALYLEADIETDRDRIEPPYQSVMPEIPTKEDIARKIYTLAKESKTNDGWALNRIEWSVRDDDFARYVLSRPNWSDIELDDESEPWPPRDEYRRPAVEFYPIENVQNYIIGRVFDLGWTPKRFEHFDDSAVGRHGRDSRKPERMGKKYQWIGYHEILAYLSDNFRYWPGSFRSHEDYNYLGPWQGSERDIDPTNTLLSSPNKDRDSDPSCWWCDVSLDYGVPEDPAAWIKNVDPTRQLSDLCISQNEQGSWFNVYGFVNREQETSPGFEFGDEEKRGAHIFVYAALVDKSDAVEFLKWAEDKNLAYHNVLSPGNGAGCFLGEHGWSPASEYFDDYFFGEEGWKEPSREFIPCRMFPMASVHLREAGGFDCATEESYEAHVPTSSLIRELGLRLQGNYGQFYSKDGELCAFDPSMKEIGTGALLFNQQWLQKYLDENELTISWIIWGEKRVYPPKFSMTRAGTVHEVLISGAYSWIDNQISGFSKHLYRSWESGKGADDDLECIDTHTTNYSMQSEPAQGSSDS